jgi:ribosomal protein L11 methyltransferase
MQWRQFVMNLDSLDPDRVEHALISLGALSITLSDAGDNPVLEPAPGETPLWSETKVCALFAADTDVEMLRCELKNLLGTDALPENHTEELEERVWEREWLKDFAPMQFGRRLWVSPVGMAVSAPDAVVIDLDPGLAFGTGTHPTTALCLEWLEQAALHGKNVLDLGCGSGILAIAALKLGAASVHAVDIDLQATSATRQNAQANGVGDKLETASKVNEDLAPFDAIVANILAGTLIEQAESICNWLKPGGLLVLSGILSAQTDDVADAYRPDIDFEAPAFLDEWARLSGTRH